MQGQNKQQQQVAEYELYKRIKLLGEGAFGKAYLVECLKDNSKWVIKQMELKAMSEQERRETLKEAKILEAFDHPNITKFREVYKTKKGKLCIVMEYADGGDLAKKTKDQRGKNFTENQILDWFVQMCLALKHVHDRKIIHRDLKGQNIFLTKNNMIKLGDFGIARVLNKTMEKAKTMVGTPYYLSPEIIEQKPYSFKTDIWSLGVILYEMCALKPPFNADSLHFLALKIVKGSYSPVPSHYSRELKGLIANLLQVNPLKRPTISDVLRTPILTKRVQSFLTESQRKYEFSHTVLHNKKVNAQVRMSDFKEVNQEVPCPAHLLQKEIQKNTPQMIQDQNKYLEQKKEQELQSQQQQNNNNNANKQNYHYKQDSWQKAKEQEQKDKQKKAEREAIRQKEIELKRRESDAQKQRQLDREKQIQAQKYREREREIQQKKDIEQKKKEQYQQQEIKKQVEAARQRELQYEREIQAKIRELEKLDQMEKQKQMQEQKERQLQRLQSQKDQEEKYQKASRDQFFNDKQQAQLYKQRAEQDRGVGARTPQHSVPDLDPPKVLQKKYSSNNSQQSQQQQNKNPRQGSVEKKRQVKSYQSKKQEDEERIQKLQQEKLDKMIERSEKRKQEQDKKMQVDEEEKQKLKDEKQKQRDDFLKQMRKDKERAKWGKQKNDFNFEIVTEKKESNQNDDESTQPSTKRSESSTAQEVKQPQKKVSKPSSDKNIKKRQPWNKPGNKKHDVNDVPIEMFVQGPIKKEENNQQKAEEEEEQKKSDQQLQEEADKNKQSEQYYKKDDLDDDSDENQKKAIESGDNLDVGDEYGLEDSSFDANEEREAESNTTSPEKNKNNSKQNSEQKLQQDAEDIPQKEQQEMNEMFKQMQDLVGGLDDLVDNLPENNNQYEKQNIFGFTDNMLPPNLKEKDDQRKSQLQEKQQSQQKSQQEEESEEQKAHSGELPDDREDDEDEPEMGSQYLQDQLSKKESEEQSNNSENNSNNQQQNSTDIKQSIDRSSNIKKSDESHEKKKKNDKKQQEAMTFIHSDYSQIEALRITLEDQMGFENFIQAYQILKNQINENQDLDTLEQLYGQQQYYQVLPFLDKQIIDDTIALLITFIIMEENWEQKMQITV